jgi:hypothetical protein
MKTVRFPRNFKHAARGTRNEQSIDEHHWNEKSRGNSHQANLKTPKSQAYQANGHGTGPKFPQGYAPVAIHSGHHAPYRIL